MQLNDISVHANALRALRVEASISNYMIELPHDKEPDSY
jgi:hypothetical protein